MVDEFLSKFEIAISEHQRFDAMNWALCVAPRNGGAHKKDRSKIGVLAGV